MTRSHGTAIVVLLVLMVAMIAYRSFAPHGGTPRFEYRATEMPAIDVAALQRAGDEGWSCNPIVVTEATGHHFVMFCRREMH